MQKSQKVIKPYRLSLLEFLWVASLFLTACQPAAPQSTGPVRVMAAETFLGDIAQNVAGDRLQVGNLLPVGVDPHEYQPKPRDVARLAEAQVLIVNGLGYETWLQKTLDSLGGHRLLIIATDGLVPASDPSGEHPQGDPHLWMDPLNAIHYVDQIRDGLSQADPAGKDSYISNAEAYITKLQALDRWVKDQVSQLPPERRLLVTNHDALGYFAKAYGFKIAGAVIPGVSSDASPTARQLASLIDTIRSSIAPAIFLNFGDNQKLAQQIASETGVKVITDLYVESLSGPGGPAPTYIDMIQHDVTVMLDALK
jgi:ABC-type Zn uptake system ZnuABC Zn-binding protein ZnuA